MAHCLLLLMLLGFMRGAQGIRGGIFFTCEVSWRNCFLFLMLPD